MVCLLIGSITLFLLIFIWGDWKKQNGGGNDPSNIIKGLSDTVFVFLIVIACCFVTPCLLRICAKILNDVDEANDAKKQQAAASSVDPESGAESGRTEVKSVAGATEISKPKKKCFIQCTLCKEAYTIVT